MQQQNQKEDVSLEKKLDTLSTYQSTMLAVCMYVNVMILTVYVRAVLTEQSNDFLRDSLAAAANAIVLA